jgi:hypothetical protein
VKGSVYIHFPDGENEAQRDDSPIVTQPGPCSSSVQDFVYKPFASGWPKACRRYPKEDDTGTVHRGGYQGQCLHAPVGGKGHSLSQCPYRAGLRPCCGLSQPGDGWTQVEVCRSLGLVSWSL